MTNSIRGDNSHTLLRLADVRDVDIASLIDGNAYLFRWDADQQEFIMAGDDDYLLLDGSREMTGDLDMGGHDIVDVGDVDGVSVSGTSTLLSTHVADTFNPHAVTLAQAGVDCFAVTTRVGTNLNGTNVAVDWDQSAYINSGGYTHSTSTNPSRVQVDASGTYRIDCTLTFDSDQQRTSIMAEARVNGSTLVAGQGATGIILNQNNHDHASVHVGTLVELTDGDYVEIICNRDAATGNVLLVDDKSVLALTRVR